MGRLFRIVFCLAIFAASGCGGLIYETQAYCQSTQPGNQYDVTVHGSTSALCGYAWANILFGLEYTDSANIRLHAVGGHDRYPGPRGPYTIGGGASAHFAGDYIFTAASGLSSGWISPCVLLIARSSSFAQATVGAASLSVENNHSTGPSGTCLSPQDTAIHFLAGVPVTFTISLTVGAFPPAAYQSSASWAELLRLQLYDEQFHSALTDVHYTLVQADVPEPSTVWLFAGGLVLAGASLSRRPQR
jgi:hypothetical protein